MMFISEESEDVLTAGVGGAAEAVRALHQDPRVAQAQLPRQARDRPQAGGDGQTCAQHAQSIED